jgi:hypothetical protein
MLHPISQPQEELYKKAILKPKDGFSLTLGGKYGNKKY